MAPKILYKTPMISLLLRYDVPLIEDKTFDKKLIHGMAKGNAFYSTIPITRFIPAPVEIV